MVQGHGTEHNVFKTRCWCQDFGAGNAGHAVRTLVPAMLVIWAGLGAGDVRVRS